VITKADKGHSVVILDRDEYLRKMESLISDRTKFEPIDHDPTIAEEDRLTRKLRCLKERRFITEQEYDLCFPSGSQPGTLYGLPKVHKVGVPLRPILSATGTFNYGIARLLVNRLSHLKKHPTTIQDTFSFVDDLHSLRLDMSEHRLISFDVVNLFTNVPLKDTIQVVLNQLYPGKCQCESATQCTPHVEKKKKKKKNNEPKCVLCLDRSDMKWLLETATSRTHFIFNGQYYSQINGVAMGSPVGPLLADIFLVHLEKELMHRLEEKGVVYWRRYVDDVLAIVRKDTNVDELINILNSFHTSIQFTSEPEVDQSLPFLDVLIRRRPSYNGSWFSTTVHRKPTYTGLILNWHSFVPIQHKRSAITSMIYRAIRITSDYALLHKEFIFIRTIAVSNGYPLPFVLNLIRQTLENHLISPPDSSSASPSHIGAQQPYSNEKESRPENKRNKRVILVDLPYVGRPTTTLGKKLVHIAKQANPLVHVQPIPRPPSKIQTMLPRKDPIPRNLLSNVVYNVNCSDCSAGYIGKTCRQVSRRFEEHGKEKRSQTPSSHPHHVPEQTSPRSQRPRRNVPVRNYASYLRDYDRTIDDACSDVVEIQNSHVSKSSIFQHQLQTGHSFDWENWKMLGKDRCFYRLLVRESLMIARHAPSLNRSVCSVPLVVYPDGPSILQPRVKMKS
jgi:hypothetical protein